MSRIDTFTFRVDRYERQLIATLANRLQRSQSDAVRFVVINAAKELEVQEQQRATKFAKVVENA